MRPIVLDELYHVGLHYGHRKEHSTPMARPFIYGVRNGICLIDLDQTKIRLEQALAFLTESAAQNRTILLVGTKKQARPLVTALARSIGLPFVTTRWLGGLLTNFATVRRSLEHMAELAATVAGPDFTHRKKSEQKRLVDALEKLHRAFDGIAKLDKIPDIIFVVDVHHESVAVGEAARLGVTLVGTVDTNGDPTKLDYPIVSNDDAPRGLKYILQRVGEAIAEGQGKKFVVPAPLAVDASVPTVIKKSGDESRSD